MRGALAASLCGGVDRCLPTALYTTPSPTLLDPALTRHSLFTLPERHYREEPGRLGMAQPGNQEDGVGGLGYWHLGIYQGGDVHRRILDCKTAGHIYLDLPNESRKDDDSKAVLVLGVGRSHVMEREYSSYLIMLCPELVINDARAMPDSL